MNSHREEFRFRLEKTSEIVKCLKELNIIVKEDEILNPDKYREQCQLVYEQLAELCTGITREEMSQPALQGLSAINYPELHEDSLPSLNTFRACSRMMETCGIHSFAVKDIIAPDSKRSRRFLSGIINFLKFREERLVWLAELNTSRDALLDRLATQNERAAAVQARLNRLKEQTAEDGRLIQTAENDIRSIESTLHALDRQEEEMRVEADTLRDRSAQLKDDLSRRAAALEEAQDTKRQLSGQVVSSPGKFRQRIVDAGVALQTEQKEVKAAERRVRELGAWLANVDDSQAEVACALEAVQEVRTEAERQRQVLAELDAMRARSDTQREQVSELELLTQQASRAVTRGEDKLVTLRRHASLRSAEGQDRLTHLRAQLAAAEAGKMQSRVRWERCESEAARLEREAEVEQQAAAQELADMTAAYQRLERLVTAHLQGLTNTLQLDTPVHSA